MRILFGAQILENLNRVPSSSVCSESSVDDGRVISAGNHAGPDDIGAVANESNINHR
ncbi:unannotated protein [freshwater metagenome]|uniref:Unannotated protein n=1 Tax=freshwater metagenome TaxID=449393 RepID=A0A6J6GFS7_9ZZZZ